MSKAKGKQPPPPQIISGHGEFQFTDGSHYNGDYIETTSPDGIKSLAREGLGTYRSIIGIYEGSWIADAMHGQGKFIFHKGEDIIGTYEGEFQNNKFHGHGKYYFADGSFYEGHWKDNVMHEQGKFVDTYNSVWEGAFHEGTYDSLAHLEDLRNLNNQNIGGALFE